MQYTKQELAKTMDHTLLRADATKKEVEKLCQEALEWGTFSVCINPCNIPLAKELLAESQVAVCTVVGFPLGQMTTEAKAFETAEAVFAGADEVDMVINVGRLKDGDFDYVRDDIQSVVQSANGKLTKVILETCLLTPEEIRTASKLAQEAGADFVKTSTGFSKGGATVEAVRMMREVVGPKMGVKASGGIRTLADAKAMLEAGATRLGVSASGAILSELK
ncbi:Deoxyribose-phosphate aldolase [Clostridiaceae bacterium JG1575]|nr:Deoxyribose-phosphate aldolase [Clostridiaceae bacterium JG1575]